jgi:hypothetical protein
VSFEVGWWTMSANNEDDDGVPLAAYYLYDGINEVPSDVTHVRVAPSVTAIRSNVFGPSEELTRIFDVFGRLVGGVVPTIEDSTRRACIRKVILPEGLRCIEKRAFIHCKSLTDIIIPSSVEEIGDEAFMHCSQLKEIDLPNGLHCINHCTFAFCTSLRFIKIPPQITTIYEGAFVGCSNLFTVDFCHESSLRKILSHAFNGCKSLTKLILPDLVEEIEMNSLKGSSLTNFRVPATMTTFDLSAFGGFNNLVSIEIPESTEQIDDHHYPLRLNSLRNIAIPPGCLIIQHAVNDFGSLIAGLYPNNDYNEAENYSQILDLLRIRFEGLSIHKECYNQTFQDNEAVMRNLRREINPWSTRGSTIRGRLNETGKMQDCLGMTPLHILTCSTRHTLEMYELIVQKYPENLVTQDKWGDVPLLYAFWCNAPEDIVRFLVENYKTRYPGYTFDWESMIETLAKNNVPTSRIQTLIETHKRDFADQECNLEDVVERLIRSFNQSELGKFLRLLLREIAFRRIEASGIGRWRIELMFAINHIDTFHWEGGRWEGGTREFYSLLDKCESLKESAGILELALWKAKLEDDDEHCNKIRKFDDDCTTTTAGRREICRINCGADIVLRNVFSYLSPRGNMSHQLRGGYCFAKCLFLSFSTLIECRRQ